MTLDELKELLEDSLASDFRITTDKRGQVIIYTGLVEDSDGELVGVDEIEEIDFELDDESDLDLEELDEDDDDDDE